MKDEMGQPVLCIEQDTMDTDDDKHKLDQLLMFCCVESQTRESPVAVPGVQAGTLAEL